MLPFYTAMKLNQAWLEALATGLRSTETMLAASSVIGTRTGMIQSAAAAPLRGNYRELSRMVPEKVAAFGAAADILAKEGRQWQEAVTALAGSAEPGVDSWFRTVDAVTALWAAPDAALRPIHRTATANARRLRKRRR